MPAVRSEGLQGKQQAGDDRGPGAQPNQAHAYVRRFCVEKFKPEFLNVTEKHPLKIMVWGCMSANGVGRLLIVDGAVNATKFIDILQNCIVLLAQQLFPHQFLFQEDSAPCHHA